MAGRVPDEESGDAIFAEINITPLTDIFLVLLVIFMVTSSVMVDAGSRSGVAVNLPKGSTRDISPSAADVTVAVTTEGRLIVDGKPVEPDQLKALFDKAHARDPDTQVIVQADESTHHGRVVGVMELAKAAGLRRLAIATRRGGAK